MSHLVTIYLPANRDLAGALFFRGDTGQHLAGPFSVCGRANDVIAAEHGNKTRDRLLPYGDFPLGTYRVLGGIATGRGTVLGERSYGRAGALVLEPIAGEAALAEATGRFFQVIHGGGAPRTGDLLATCGSLRLTDKDMPHLLRLARQFGDLICEVVETEPLFPKLRIREEPLPEAFDPPRVPPSSISALREGGISVLRRRLLKGASSSIALAALRGIGSAPLFAYALAPKPALADQYGGGGTHIETRDGMALEVRNGYHLESSKEGLTEVRDKPRDSAPKADTKPPDRSQPPEPTRESPPDVSREVPDTTIEAPVHVREPHDPPEHPDTPRNPQPEPVPPPGSSTTPTPPPATSVPPAYTALDGAVIPPELQQRIVRIANAFHAASGRTLQITSGSRSAERQAKAMFDKIRGGENPYADAAAYNEILSAYNSAQAEGMNRTQTEAAMAAVIATQMARGVFISRHLTGRAVDVRTRDLSPADKTVLDALVSAEGGTIIHEGAPPHTHYQF
jgi:hypothetical protein